MVSGLAPWRHESQTTMKRIIIFANGELPDIPKARSLLQSDDYILCADGGTRHAMALGIKPNLVIGDMDSAERELLQKLKELDVSLELFPHDKNETDLELAIHRAIELGPRQIVIVAALGGRLDQTLANISLLTTPVLAEGVRVVPVLLGSAAPHPSLEIRLDDGVEEIFLCRDQVQVYGKEGDLVSLLPWQGAVSEIKTENLKWALRNETLYPNKTRGISNEMTTAQASISIGSGLLLIVHRRV